MFKKCSMGLMLVLASWVLLPPVPAEGVSLLANFNLYGEVNRLNTLGYGTLDLQFSLDGTELARGGINYAGSGSPATTGVLVGLSLPSTGFAAVNFNFAVPFDLDPGQVASLELKIYASAIRLVYDFANGITLPGSVIGNVGEQGLVLTSLTLANGRPLTDLGLDYAFISDDTFLSVELSNGSSIYRDTQSPPEIASLLYPGGTCAVGLASVDPLVKLSICPEPNPLIVDYCWAKIYGEDNFVISGAPLPGTLLLLGSGILSLIGWRRFRKS